MEFCWLLPIFTLVWLRRGSPAFLLSFERYRFLLKWDVALHALEESSKRFGVGRQECSGFASDEHLLVSSQHEEPAMRRDALGGRV